MPWRLGRKGLVSLLTDEGPPMAGETDGEEDPGAMVCPAEGESARVWESKGPKPGAGVSMHSGFFVILPSQMSLHGD